ncbi:phosphoribosyltransferase [Streptomyces sp. NPDC090075]|uniref:phosphoribosyltransferase n=1 Tax=unclassified Streptomyces TaxID=2593676 RepID=UPI0033C2F302
MDHSVHQVTWTQVEEFTSQLAGRITADGSEFDQITAVARGGFVPARLLASELGVARLGSIGVRYPDATRAVPEIHAPVTGLRSTDRVLLVEDAIESGRSMLHAATAIRPHVAQVVTAAYFRLPNAVMGLDFALGERAQLPRFPWE